MEHFIQSQKMSILEGKTLPLPVLSIPELLNTTVKESPEQEIIFYDGVQEEILTYSQILKKAKTILANLQVQGIKEGDHVILHFDSNREMITAFWACFLGNLIPTTSSVPEHYSPSHIEIRKLRNSLEKLSNAPILTGSSLSQNLANALKNPEAQIIGWEDLSQESPKRPLTPLPPDPKQTAFQLQTSGTTGVAKLVQISHENVISSILGINEVLSLSKEDISLNWTPLSHVGGIIMFHLRDLYLQCRQILIPTKVVRETPLFWLQCLSHYQATISWGPQLIYSRLANLLQSEGDLALDLSNIRYLINGGDQVLAPPFKRFLQECSRYGLRKYVEVIAWGMTETAGGAIMHVNAAQDDFDLAARGLSRNGVSVGTPLPNLIIKVVNAQGELVPQGTQGTLKVKGKGLTAAYYKNEKANRESFDEEGWFNTGDLAQIVDNKLEIMGRTKDMLILGSVNIFCNEIEEGLCQEFGIPREEIAVVGFRQGEEQMDQLALFYQPSRGNQDINFFIDYLNKNYGFSQVFWVSMASNAFPRNDMEKVQRAKLQMLLQENYSELNITIQEVPS